jgi:osmotically-inducible protein OsmY
MVEGAAPSDGRLDDALGARVDEALRATGYSCLRGLHISVSGGRVRLAGRVPSYYAKQVAQEAALAVAGVGGLLNELEVARSLPRAP